MSTPFKQSKEVKKYCLVCGDHFSFKYLKNGVCLQCWGWSAIGHYIDAIREVLKHGEHR